MKRFTRLRRTMAVITACCLLLNLFGCWDSAEINGRAFVLGLGIDQSAEGDGLAFTFQMAIPVSGGSDSSEAVQYTVCTVTEASAAAAIRLLEKNTGRQINFEQLVTILIGEELSHSSFTGVTEWFFRRASVRRQSCVAVCEGTAREFLSASTVGKVISFDAARTLQSYDDTGGTASSSMNLYSLYKTVSNRDEFYLLKIAAVMPDTPTEEASDTVEMHRRSLHISGAAAYGRDGGYRGSLSSRELELLRLLSNRQISGMLPVPNHEGNDTVYYQIKQSRCEKSCVISDDTLHFSIGLNVQCIVADGLGLAYDAADSEPFLSAARQHINRSLTEEIETLAQKSRSSLGSSVMGLQDLVRQQYPDWYEKQASHWEEWYGQSDIELHISCQISGGGITK